MQPKKKFAEVEDPLDPLSGGSMSASAKKGTAQDLVFLR